MDTIRKKRSMYIYWTWWWSMHVTQRTDECALLFFIFLRYIYIYLRDLFYIDNWSSSTIDDVLLRKIVWYIIDDYNVCLVYLREILLFKVEIFAYSDRQEDKRKKKWIEHKTTCSDRENWTWTRSALTRIKETMMARGYIYIYIYT